MKNLENLGKILNKKEQQSINGGNLIVTDCRPEKPNNSVCENSVKFYLGIGGCWTWLCVRPNME